MSRCFARPAILTVLIACALTAAAGDDARRLDAHRYLGSPLQVENLTVWPVHSRAPAATPEIWSLHDAQKAGLARVREKGAGAGTQRRDAATVNQLVIENASHRPILVTAGTILKGGPACRP